MCAVFVRWPAGPRRVSHVVASSHFYAFLHPRTSLVASPACVSFSSTLFTRIGAAVFDFPVHAGQLGADHLGGGLREESVDDCRGDARLWPRLRVRDVELRWDDRLDGGKLPVLLGQGNEAMIIVRLGLGYASRPSVVRWCGVCCGGAHASSLEKPKSNEILKGG